MGQVMELHSRLGIMGNFGRHQIQRLQASTLGTSISSFGHTLGEVTRKTRDRLAAIISVPDIVPLTQDDALSGLQQTSGMVKRLTYSLSGPDSKDALRGLQLDRDTHTISWMMPDGRGRVEITPRDYRIITFDTAIADTVHVLTDQRDTMSGHHYVYSQVNLQPQGKTQSMHIMRSEGTERLASSLNEHIALLRDRALEAYGIQSPRQIKEESLNTARYIATHFAEIRALRPLYPVQFNALRNERSAQIAPSEYGLAIVKRREGQDPQAIGYVSVNTQLGLVVLTMRPDASTNYVPAYIYCAPDRQNGKAKASSIHLGLVPSATPLDIAQIRLYPDVQDIMSSGAIVARELFEALAKTHRFYPTSSAQDILLDAVPGLAERVTHQAVVRGRRTTPLSAAKPAWTGTIPTPPLHVSSPQPWSAHSLIDQRTMDYLAAYQRSFGQRQAS